MIKKVCVGIKKQIKIGKYEKMSLILEFLVVK